MMSRTTYVQFQLLGPLFQLNKHVFLSMGESGLFPQLYRLGVHDGGYALWDIVWFSGEASLTDTTEGSVISISIST